jgi:XTP/dITP diphosphohydrolase
MMNSLSYITSNPEKAKQMSRLLGYNVEIVSIVIPEIQSLDLQEVIKHKTSTAYNLLKKPLFLDDVSLVISAMNRLPGPLIKFFIQELGSEKICDIVNLFNSRDAIAQAIIGYHDGRNMHFFKGEVRGQIALKPNGKKGFGWDNIFIPQGYSKVRAEMTDYEYDQTSPRAIAFNQLKAFLQH